MYGNRSEKLGRVGRYTLYFFSFLTEIAFKMHEIIHLPENLKKKSIVSPVNIHRAGLFDHNFFYFPIRGD